MRNQLKFASTICLSLILFLALPAHADTLFGKVISVGDGDTVTVLDHTHTQHKIRLAGIDAPEKKQAFGNLSKRSLADMVAGQSVTVEWGKIDKYGRKVGKVMLEGQDCNLMQVKRGLAWHYKAYERERSVTDRLAYSDAEVEAKAARRGLWADSLPAPPWEFRHKP